MAKENICVADQALFLLIGRFPLYSGITDVSSWVRAWCGMGIKGYRDEFTIPLIFNPRWPYGCCSSLFQFISWVPLSIWLAVDKSKVFEIMLESTDHGRASQCHSVCHMFVGV